MMDEHEIQKLLRRGNKEPQFIEYRREYIEKFATEQGRTFDAHGEALYRIASFLDAKGNRGLSTRFFEDGLPVDAIENAQHAPVWGRILWKNDDDLWFPRSEWLKSWVDEILNMSRIGRMSLFMKLATIPGKHKQFH
jgi:hypothetical protein